MRQVSCFGPSNNPAPPRLSMLNQFGVWSSGFSRSGIDRLGSREFIQRRVFIFNIFNVRPWAA
jgi:hypothetical protein